MKSLRFLAIIVAASQLAARLFVPSAAAQTAATLGLNTSNSYAVLTISGTVGGPYEIQSSTNLLGPSGWKTFTNITLPSSPYVLAVSNPIPNGGYFRAVTILPTNMVFIAPGKFVMGSPTSEQGRISDEVQHLVTLTNGFFMAKYLVTQGQYQALMGTNPSYFSPNTSPYPLDTNLPVETVTWTNAATYCALLTTNAYMAGRMPHGWVYRLPTEAEWEYACRAGSMTAFYLGSELLSGQANFDGKKEYSASTGTFDDANGIFLNQTSDVGNYGPNANGLYDMIGNTFEWVYDWYAAYPTTSVTNPVVTIEPANNPQRVARGGSWLVDGVFCRSAQRFEFGPTDSVNYTGFRIVLAPAIH